MASFDPEEARRQLDRNGLMEVDCPLCDVADWRVGELQTGLLAVAPEGHIDFTDPNAARVVTVVCTSCGFVRFHDPSFLS